MIKVDGEKTALLLFFTSFLQSSCLEVCYTGVTAPIRAGFQVAMTNSSYKCILSLCCCLARPALSYDSCFSPPWHSGSRKTFVTLSILIVQKLIIALPLRFSVSSSLNNTWSYQVLSAHLYSLSRILVYVFTSLQFSLIDSTNRIGYFSFYEAFHLSAFS